MKNRYTLGLLATLSMLSFSCSKGQFATSSSTPTCVENCGLDTGGGSNGGSSSPDFSQLDGNIASNKAEYNNFLSLSFDKIKGEFIVAIPLPEGFFPFTQGNITGLPGARYSTIIGADGKAKLAVRIPAEYVLKGVKFLPPAKLPNGDDLPAMPAGKGELPGLAMEIPTNSSKSKVYLYVGVNAVGLFVTLPESVKIPIGFTFPIRNKDRSRTLGYFTYVPYKVVYPAGLFVSSIIPPELAQALMKYLDL